MEERIFQIALAGLLHDIGKLEQRAREDPWLPPENVKDEKLPVHAAWTIHFIETYLPKAYRTLALPAGFHHHSEKFPGADRALVNLLELADKLSAGERSDIEEKGKNLPKQMVTIFDRISTNEGKKQGDWHYLPLKPLQLEESALFPGDPVGKKLEVPAYEVLCEVVRNAASENIADPTTYLENLYGAMEQAAWCVPSAFYHSIPDVSLFDHSRMTAALAVCLNDQDPAYIMRMLTAVQHEFTGNPDAADAEVLTKPAALLLGGDISGIQSFLYTLSAQKAAKTLRGRSFYLQLLTEAALRFVLNELELPCTQVIYSGGGHFYLLAPLSAQEKLPLIQKKVSEILLRHHGINLYLALGSAVVPLNGFKLGQFPEYWGKMHAALAKQKQQRYRELGDGFIKQIFEPVPNSGNEDDLCSVCGEDAKTSQVKEDDGTGNVRICSLCQSMIEELGELLPGKKFLALGSCQPVNSTHGTASQVLQDFGLRFQFVKDKHDKVDLDCQHLTLWALDDPADGKFPASAIPAARRLHYTVNQVPPHSFDELQKYVKGGFKRLAVLRMDVDNLGSIFQEGFGKKGEKDNCATLARLATLSSQISLFFEGWVKRICEQGERKDLVYTVYAGGDDLFLLGPWDRIPDLAMQLVDDFKRYTAFHPAMHVSAGISFIGGKYPIYQAAADAGEAEAKAKDKEGKNAVTFLGEAWKWQDFGSLNEQKNRLLEFAAADSIASESEGGSQAVIQLLRSLASEEEIHARDHGRPIYGSWLWRGAYLLTRMAERAGRGDPELARKLTALRDELHHDHYHSIHRWGKAARWAQLLSRKTKKEN